VEYNRVLVEPGQRRRFAEALLRELGADRGWDELTLDGFAPEDALPFLLSEPRLTDRLEPCRTVDLRRAGPAGGHVLPILPSSARRKVRRSLDVLGDVETEWAETEDHALDILEELVLLHQTRWTAAGRPGAFASRRVASFHRELVARLLPRGAVILFRIRARSGTVGCLYHFVERDRVLFYQSGFSPFENDRAVTSGFVTHALCMQSCFDRGLVEYDFLAGQSRYKDDLATDTRELVWATYRRPAVKWRIVDALAAAKRA
jgi:CelD/BcsL family acetyltransferase involved in cellulose biosynthesis